MKYFSSRVATGYTFCDREDERKELVHSMKQNEHCVVVAPRRYGKTSLVIQSIKEAKLFYSKIDLFCVVYEQEVVRKIAKGVSELAQQLMTRTDKTLSFLEGVFKQAIIGLKAGSFEITIDFSRNITPVEHVEDLLSGLEEIAAKSKKQVVFFIDEFQDILKIEKSNQIQAAIRSVAQHSQYVTYIFSGSSRVMLEKIFDDANQPLYMMCNKILLGRISEAHFKEHIQKASMAHWGEPLTSNVLDKVLLLSERHTYYVNILCSELIVNDEIPSEETVDLAWQKLMFKYKGKIIAELEKLTTNRLKVLSNVSLFGKVSEPNSKEFLDKVGLPLSSAQTAVQYLLEHDYIYQTERGSIALVDPLMKLFLQERYD